MLCGKVLLFELVSLLIEKLGEMLLMKELGVLFGKVHMLREHFLGSCRPEDILNRRLCHLRSHCISLGP